MISKKTAVETLTALALGQIDIPDAAATLGLSEEAFLKYTDQNPPLLAEAEERAQALRLCPERTLARSNAGLSAAIETLAVRLETSGSDMTTGELVQASTLLEKLIGLSESRKAEVKSGSRPQETERLPLLVLDTRPNAVTEARRLKLILIPPDSPLWVDATKPDYQTPAFDWLEHFCPLSPTTGEALEVGLLTRGGRYMDESGRVFG